MSALDLNTLAELYDWLDTIPFSKPKKNLARDFSDATLTAELIKYFFPSWVEMHNYPSTNSVEQKKINWSILSLKVLKRLDYPLSDMTVFELASAKREAIEYFLNSLRWKIHDLLKHKKQKGPTMKGHESGDTTEGKNGMKTCSSLCQSGARDSSNALTSKTIPDNRSTASRKSSANGSLKSNRSGKKKDDSLENNIAGDCGTAEDRVQSSPSRPESRKNKRWMKLRDSYLDTVPVQLYDQKIQELAEKNEEIQVLNARIQRLEYMLSFKDVTITRQEQLIQELRRSHALQGGEGRFVSSNETLPKMAKTSRSN